MADLKQHINTDPIEKEIKALQQSKRDSDKRIKELKLQKTLSKDVETWKKIQAVKDNAVKELKKIEGCGGWNLSKLVKTPTYYTYQNPNNTKEKANDESIEWVVNYKKKNNSLAALIKKADETKIDAVKKIFGRTKKRSKTKTTGTGKSNTNTPKKNIRSGIT